ncbi:MAG: methyltransferase domain-containing protein [Alphaproteobacteria bacterium]|nr:methyltransferase domain-containing protein [Alphaproteobacteria bacterium]
MKAAIVPSHGSNTYVLGTGEEAAKRLNQQNEVMKENSMAQLKRAGLSKGQIVFDVGCGSGSMTKYLAEQVGKEGHVYAIDISKDQLTVTQSAMEEAGLFNVTYVQGDILDALTLPDVKADIIYTRYVLMHLKKPEKAVAIIKQYLKPGGASVGQESILDEVYTEPTCDIIERTKVLRQKMAAHLCVNHNIGQDLQVLYEDAGYTVVEVYRTDYRIPVIPFNTVYSKSFHEMAEKYIKIGLMKEEESDFIKQQLKDLPLNHPDLFYIFEQCHVIARTASP